MGAVIFDPDLDAARWDLELITGGGGVGAVRRWLAEARSRADALASDYAGAVARLDAAGLIALVTELNAILDLLALAQGYAGKWSHLDSADPGAIELLAAAEETGAEVSAALSFFEVEWIALEPEHVHRLLTDAGDRLDFASHHLHRVRARRPYVLGGEAERILAETSVPRLRAWKRLYTEVTSALAVQLDGETVPLTEAESRLQSAHRDVRVAAARAIGEGLSRGLAPRMAVYNQVLGEKAIDDRLRGYPTWLSARNLANETTDEQVTVQLEAINARRDLVQRWCRLKATLLGLDRLATSDLRAPLPTDARTVPYAEARETVLRAWEKVSPRAAETLAGFFDGYVDAPIRLNKQGGALCSENGTHTRPFILLNYTGHTRDTLTLAHELGHGLHFELCRPQGYMQYTTSIPMVEVPSTFSEAVVSDHLLEIAASDAHRLEILTGRLDEAMLNIFEGTAMHRSEQRWHTHRRERGELSADKMRSIWVEEAAAMFGDTVEIEESYAMVWSSMPHMIWEPGYLYSYSYGVLTAWSAFARYQEHGPAFAEYYLEMLAAGGSRSPQRLAAMIGLDVTAPEHWDTALDLVEQALQQAERLTAASDRP